MVAAIDEGLRARSAPERAAQERAYLKSAIDHYGTRVPDVRTVVHAALPRRPAPPHDLVVDVAVDLWGTPVHERRLAAVIALARHVAVLGPDDVPLVERFLREARTWALVDPICTDVMGPLVVAHPGLGVVLDRWSTDDDFWLRRASMLTLLRPLRAGGGDWGRFTRYADAMLEEREFFVRKAIGWILRDTGRRRPDLVHEWILPRAARASGVTLREAVKPLSPAQRDEVLAAR